MIVRIALSLVSRSVVAAVMRIFWGPSILRSLRLCKSLMSAIGSNRGFSLNVKTIAVSAASILLIPMRVAAIL